MTLQRKTFLGELVACWQQVFKQKQEAQGTGWVCSRVGSQTYGFQDPCGVLVQPGRVNDFIVQYGLKQVILVLCLEGGVATEHLIEQYAHGPPVHRRPVQHFLQDLSRERERQ